MGIYKKEKSPHMQGNLEGVEIPHHQEFARQYGNERVYQSNIFFSFIQIGEEYRPVNVSLRKIIVSQYR